MTDPFFDPSLCVALALATGILAQSLAHHINIPGIVVLLATGVILGPQLAGVIQPDALGDALPVLVQFAVAVILFEGGMNLNFPRLIRARQSIRRLVTWGALVTAVGGALSAYLVMGWDWRTSVIFGTLVIVTGPTVITPLLRRLKLEKGVSTVLEAEGVLIDPVGAVLAVVALEVVLRPSGATLATGAMHVATGLVGGAVLGAVGGYLLARVLQVKNLIPEGLENVTTLAVVLALFQTTNALIEEGGIAAVTACGMVIGNTKTLVHRDLLEFKEQLTVMLIGMLFVLLAADIKVSDVQALGWNGLITCGLLMFVVRPLNVAVGTVGSDLSFRQKFFIAWIAPRGIVAAAVALFVAHKLDEVGLDTGPALRAMVFLVIAVTVLAAGLTGGPVATFLGLRRKQNAGWVILGASPLARALARILSHHGEDAVLVDTNHEACHAAEREGLRVLYGNGLEERTMRRAEIDIRAGVVGLTRNEEVNFLFAQKARSLARHLRLLVSLEGSGEGGVRASMVHGEGAHVVFGRGHDVDLWSLKFRQGRANVQAWTRGEGEELSVDVLYEGKAQGLWIAVAKRRGSAIRPVTDMSRLRTDDTIYFLVNLDREDEAKAWLTDNGWNPQPDALTFTAQSSPASVS